MITLNAIKDSADFIRPFLNGMDYEIGVVLGTGFGDILESMEVVKMIPYSEIPGFPRSTVSGHKGNLYIGTLQGNKILVMQGRFHYYEGYSMQQVTFPIRVLGMLGIRKLIMTNASGGVNLSYRVGDIMVISDHLNLLPEQPLRGKNIDELGPRFPGMIDAYDPNLRRIAMQAASDVGLPVREGVYAALQGPSYETKAEYHWLRTIGADAVGMSTVPEVIVARHMNIACLGISLITNGTATENELITSHSEVLSVGERRKIQLKMLLEGIISRL